MFHSLDPVIYCIEYLRKINANSKLTPPYALHSLHNRLFTSIHLSLQLLFVRHQFKIGFYNEQRNDPTLARKHYTQAYRYLQELNLHHSNMLEVKTVAGYLIYKVCIYYT